MQRHVEVDIQFHFQAKKRKLTAAGHYSKSSPFLNVLTWQPSQSYAMQRLGSRGFKLAKSEVRYYQSKDPSYLENP